MASVIRGDDNFDSGSIGGLGQGQTWQNVASSRSAGTAYQNTTGSPIAVAETLSVSWNPTFQLSSDGVSWVTLATGDAYTDVPYFGIVPDGQYYRVNSGFLNWSELR